MGYELPAGCETVTNKVSPFTRKAPYHFGWDWGPRFVTSGIWKPVKLIYWDQASIADALVVTKSIGDEKAELVCQIELQQGAQAEGLVLELEGIGTVAVADQTLYQIPFKMNDPRLWWPNGMGAPHLYERWLWLKKEGRVLDSVQVRFGIRTIELVNAPDSLGTSFYFVVNGRPLFAKGANYIPQDLFLPRVTDQQYRNLIKAVKEAHMNMLRVWGGGVYEKDHFYDLCDENGILVWQDFMFAGSLYPGNEQFMNSVAKEVEQQVKRLRSHPSLALWCGNNEIEVAWNNWSWQRQFGYSPADSARIWNDYLKIFHELIPSLVTKHGGGVAYVPTSPLSNWGEPENFNHSSMHYWGVWHGKEPFSAFKNNVGRFMVEYGFQSFPSASSFEGYIAPIDLDLGSQSMEQRQKSYIGNKMIFKHLRELFPEPTNFESFAWYSQLTQAVGLKKAIESHRLKKGHCMGTLYWQLNDCWPGPSWSSLDYLGNKKPAYHVAKDRYKTDILVADTTGDDFSIWVVSDRYADWKGTIQIRLLSVAGKEVWVTSQPVSIAAGSVKKVYNSHVNKLLDGSRKGEVFLELKLLEADDVLDEELFYFCPYKEVKGLDLDRLEL
jgi:beta-mannosidase